MTTFERYLSVWVAVSIVVGIALGQFAPGIFEVLAEIEFAKVNLVVGILIWVMVYPMMISVDFASISRVKDQPRGLFITLVVNWLIKPFSMAALGVLFFNVVFQDYIPPEDAEGYIAGLILLGAAPCTAWSLYGRSSPKETRTIH